MTLGKKSRKKNLLQGRRQATLPRNSFGARREIQAIGSAMLNGLPASQQQAKREASIAAARSLHRL